MKDNGLYQVAQVGTAETPWVLTRIQPVSLPTPIRPWRWEDQIWQTRVRYRGTFDLRTGKVTLDSTPHPMPPSAQWLARRQPALR